VEHRPLRTHYDMDTAVMCIDLFPGLTEATLRHQLATPGIKGIVLKTYGAGNAPTAKWFTDAIREAVERGVVIVNVTQCVNGGVQKRYRAGDTLAACGTVSGHDITAEAALAKLMYLFGLGLPPEEVRDHFAHSICGEITI
ncbi:MAG: L-asparaginase 1, partial [Paramuribaculum sp.]|nr:L-asparaginase 1 [Paramuribaculum sp.]